MTDLDKLDAAIQRLIDSREARDPINPLYLSDLGRELLAIRDGLRKAKVARPGWRLVPVEPTPEMLRAAYPYHWRLLGAEFCENWKKAIAAAPEPK